MELVLQVPRAHLKPPQGVSPRDFAPAFRHMLRMKNDVPLNQNPLGKGHELGIAAKVPTTKAAEWSKGQQGHK